MTKVVVDDILCIGCGSCVSACPECFAFNEEGKSEVVGNGACDCDIQEVADACPVDAIAVTDKE